MYIIISWWLFIIIYQFEKYLIDHCSGIAHHYTTPHYNINCLLQEKVSFLSKYHLVDNAIIIYDVCRILSLIQSKSEYVSDD